MPKSTEPVIFFTRTLSQAGESALTSTFLTRVSLPEPSLTPVRCMTRLRSPSCSVWTVVAMLMTVLRSNLDFRPNQTDGIQGGLSNRPDNEDEPAGRYDNRAIEVVAGRVSRTNAGRTLGAHSSPVEGRAGHHSRCGRGEGHGRGFTAADDAVADGRADHAVGERRDVGAGRDLDRIHFRKPDFTKGDGAGGEPHIEFEQHRILVGTGVPQAEGRGG